ncbi:MAG TPA: hypothetical protein VF189_02895 [Patescibacteria group bacterium]
MPSPHNKLKNAILETLAYFDIFDFPLLESEIFKFLHYNQKIDFKEFKKVLKEIPNERYGDTRFYFLPKRKEIVVQRIEKGRISWKKIKAVQKILKVLGFIPTIQFMGISGSLAMKNGDDNSDLDLFVITSNDTLWSTRFFIWLILIFLGRQRRREDLGIDMICVNMIVDRSKIAFPKERQDIYTAHEIIQLLPIVNKNNTYEFFLKENKWVLNFLPNGFESGEKIKKSDFAVNFLSFFNKPFEKLLNRLQIWYMSRHRTIEEVGDNFVAFHPYNYRGKIIREFEEKKKKYEI